MRLSERPTADELVQDARYALAAFALAVGIGSAIGGVWEMGHALGEKVSAESVRIQAGVLNTAYNTAGPKPSEAQLNKATAIARNADRDLNEGAAGLGSGLLIATLAANSTIQYRREDTAELFPRLPKLA